MLIKKRANADLNADQSNFLTNKPVTFALRLYVYKIIQINLHPKQSCKIAYSSLKEHVNTWNWIPRRYKIPTLEQVFWNRWIYQKWKAFVKPIWRQYIYIYIYIYIFRGLKWYLAEPFSKRLSVSLTFALIFGGIF